MRLLFTFTACITMTGVLSDSQRVEVKEGENVPLVTKTPEMGKVNRVDLLKYENGTKLPIFRYCSLKEEKTGCVAVQPERISLQHGRITVTLPNVRAKDAGQYVVHVIGNNFTSKTSFTLVFSDSSGGQFMTTISPDGVVDIAVVIPVVIGVLITAMVIICVYKKKNQKKPNDQQDSTADSSSETSLIEMQVNEPWTDGQSHGIHSDATNSFIALNVDHTDCNYDTDTNNNNNSGI